MEVLNLRKISAGATELRPTRELFAERFTGKFRPKTTALRLLSTEAKAKEIDSSNALCSTSESPVNCRSKTDEPGTLEADSRPFWHRLRT
jgi:hypothetical protein